MSNLEIIHALRRDSQKKRVAGYARVSTADEHQDSSYRLQIQELENSIVKNPRFEFIGIFKDRKSGRNTKDRQEFNAMINLAMAGEIDVIVTKSITRFGRNLLDTISLVRELKIHNVEVLFQKEGITTADPSIEMILTVLAMHAEEESKNISDNTNWSFQRKMRAGGNFTDTLYGYKINGERWQIKESEAKIVRMIFDMYIQGHSYQEIITKLKELNVASPQGKKTWCKSTIQSTLKNEKYAGHMLLGKTFVLNGIRVISRRIDIENNIIRDHHEPIVSPETFEQAMSIRDKRFRKLNYVYRPYNECITPFSRFVYSKENETFLRHKIERPKNKYEIPTLFCYSRTNDNRIMITIKNLYAILNDGLGKLSQATYKLYTQINNEIEARLAFITEELKGESTNKLVLLNHKSSLIKARDSLMNFIKRLRNFSSLNSVEEFKKIVRVVEIENKLTYSIKLNLLDSDILNLLLLKSSLNLKVGSKVQEVSFFIYI